MDDKQVYRGKVAFFSNKLGYGFIFWEIDGLKQKDLFVHFSDIRMAEGEYKTIRKDSDVIFQIGINNHGKPKAINVEEVKL